MPFSASGMSKLRLMRSTVRQSSAAWNSRPERDAVERQAVAPQRGLAFGAADDVVPIVLVQILSRLGDDLVQVEEFRRSRLLVRGGGLL